VPDDATLTTMRGETARLARLVDDLQAVSRAEEQQLQLDVRAVRPAALLDAAACAARPAASAADVELAVEAAPDLPRVAVDEGRVAEVFDNLIGNALRHTAAGGSVTLSASADANTVELCIQDTGSGIAPEHLERVFERFFRADAARSRPQGGTGIALAIARAIVEAHGGRIAAASDGPGTGATFTITLPRAR